jgi:hypothetical protein
MKCSLLSLIPFLTQFCKLPTPELDSVFLTIAANYLNPSSSCLRSSSYSLGAAEDTAFSIVVCWLTASEVYYLPHSCIATSAAPTTENAACSTSFIVAWRHSIGDAFLCCVRKGTLPDNGCFSASTILALSKYATAFCSAEPHTLSSVVKHMIVKNESSCV